jgi:hypothetical protein
VRPINGDLRAQTETLLTRARGFVGRFKVTLSPANAQLSINGSPATLSGDTLLTFSACC